MRSSSRWSVVAGCALACAFVLGPTMTRAQTWPTKPVRVVVAFAAGGPVDSMARTFAPYFSREWGQPVLVENRPGTGGQIAAELVAKSAPDGHTLLMTSSSTAVGPALYKRLNFDPVNELTAVAMLVAAPSILAANPSLPANTVKELIALAKANPGKLNYGSSGVGSGPQLAMEILKSLTGMELVHVPYKGDAQLYPALMANEVQVAIIAAQVGTAQIRAGKFKALAVTSPQRFWSLPDVPGMVESGVTGFDYRPWVGILAPAQTPREIVNRINAGANKTLGSPEVVSKHLPAWGSEAMPNTPEAFHARYLSEIQTYKNIVRKANIPQID